MELKKTLLVLDLKMIGERKNAILILKKFYALSKQSLLISDVQCIMDSPLESSFLFDLTDNKFIPSNLLNNPNSDYSEHFCILFQTRLPETERTKFLLQNLKLENENEDEMKQKQGILLVDDLATVSDDELRKAVGNVLKEVARKYSLFLRKSRSLFCVIV